MVKGSNASAGIAAKSGGTRRISCWHSGDFQRTIHTLQFFFDGAVDDSSDLAFGQYISYTDLHYVYHTILQFVKLYAVTWKIQKPKNLNDRFTSQAKSAWKTSYNVKKKQPQQQTNKQKKNQQKVRREIKSYNNRPSRMAEDEEEKSDLKITN